MIPRESEGESLKDSLARVHRCILGGKTTENSDSDSDIEVVADSVTVSLRDPMSGSRIRIAGRFKGCVHMGCFDLETFIVVNQRSRKWQCPTCLKNYSLESILIDPYFNRITSLMQHCGEDVNEVELRPDGCWRAKIQGEYNDNDLCGWHFPDGSLCGQTYGETSTSEMSRQLKQAGSSEGFTGLKFDLKRKSNGMWEVGTMNELPSSGNNVQQESESNCQKIMHVRSNVTGSGSYRALEDTSVNGAKLFGFPSNACHEIVSINEIVGHRFPAEEGPILAQPRDENVILISDSDEEDTSTINPQGIDDAVPNPCRMAVNLLTCNPSISGDFKLPNYGAFTSDFINRTTDLGSPLWEMQLNPEDFQFLHSDISISDALVDAPGPNAIATTDACRIMTELGQLLQKNNAEYAYDAEMNGSLVNNPLAFGCDDPSLQIFLPTQPDSRTVHAGMGEQSKLTSGVFEDGWISLAPAADGIQTAAIRECRPNSRNHLFPDENWPESMENDSGSPLLSLNKHDGFKATSNSQKPDASFPHSHQERSMRSRFMFTLDIDSDSQ